MFNLMRPWLYISTKCQADLLPFIQATDLDCHIPISTSFSQKSLGCLIDYSLVV